jgi:hypothetical protein
MTNYAGNLYWLYLLLAFRLHLPMLGNALLVGLIMVNMIIAQQELIGQNKDLIGYVTKASCGKQLNANEIQVYSDFLRF